MMNMPTLPEGIAMITGAAGDRLSNLIGGFSVGVNGIVVGLAAVTLWIAYKKRRKLVAAASAVMLATNAIAGVIAIFNLE